MWGAAPYERVEGRTGPRNAEKREGAHLGVEEMYVEGVSTKKVENVTEELCGSSFSKSLVSSLAGSPDSELEA
jgi:transposase-like protein